MYAHLPTEIHFFIIYLELLIHQHHPPLFHHHHIGAIKLRGMFVGLCQQHGDLAFDLDHRRHPTRGSGLGGREKRGSGCVGTMKNESKTHTKRKKKRKGKVLITLGMGMDCSLDLFSGYILFTQSQAHAHARKHSSTHARARTQALIHARARSTYAARGWTVLGFPDIQLTTQASSNTSTQARAHTQVPPMHREVIVLSCMNCVFNKYTAVQLLTMHAAHAQEDAQRAQIRTHKSTHKRIH